MNAVAELTPAHCSYAMCEMHFYVPVFLWLEYSSVDYFALRHASGFVMVIWFRRKSSSLHEKFSPHVDIASSNEL